MRSRRWVWRWNHDDFTLKPSSGLTHAETVIYLVHHMKTATVRELRNEFPRIESWVHEGESISISKRGRVIATLVPAMGASSDGVNLAKPDIMARLKETWGSRVFSMDEVRAMREAELEGEDG
jgi:antitoxin (DNA-binding transcriptional repressor) of toxin-antitoxin stability system